MPNIASPNVAFGFFCSLTENFLVFQRVATRSENPACSGGAA
jgi:hypothetical protein